MFSNLPFGPKPVLPKISPALFRHLCILIGVIALSFYAAKGVTTTLKYGTIPPQVEPLPIEQAKDTATGPQTGALSAYKPIIEVNIFGGNTEDVQEEEPEIDLESIPLALDSLKLKLVGTVVGKDRDDNIAFIEDTQKRKQEMYREGEKVKNVTVDRILRSSVIINTGSRDEILTMKPEEVGGSSEQRSASSASGRTPEPSQADTRAIQQEVLDQSLNNLNQLMQDAQIDTFIEDGKPSGFRFSNIRSGSFYEKLGLQNNDIITTINGQEFTDPSQFLTLQEQLEYSDDVTMTIKRGAGEQVVRYEIIE
ncbi:MAG: type II secretion system protein GspC [Desulfovibrionales bacterium]